MIKGTQREKNEAREKGNINSQHKFMSLCIFTTFLISADVAHIYIHMSECLEYIMYKIQMLLQASTILTYKNRIREHFFEI